MITRIFLAFALLSLSACVTGDKRNPGAQFLMTHTERMSPQTPPDYVGGVPACPERTIRSRECLDWMQGQERAYWENYKANAPALRNGAQHCQRIWQEFGDWTRESREELLMMDRNHNREGYLPGTIRREIDWWLKEHFYEFDWKIRQIKGNGASSAACEKMRQDYQLVAQQWMSRFPKPDFYPMN